MARPAGFIVASYGQKSKMEMKLSWNGNKPHSLRVIIKWDCSMWVVYGVNLTTSLSCILSSIRSNGSDISQDVMISQSLILEDKLCQINICFSVLWGTQVRILKSEWSLVLSRFIWSENTLWFMLYIIRSHSFE